MIRTVVYSNFYHLAYFDSVAMQGILQYSCSHRHRFSLVLGFVNKGKESGCSSLLFGSGSLIKNLFILKVTYPETK